MSGSARWWEPWLCVYATARCVCVRVYFLRALTSFLYWLVTDVIWSFMLARRRASSALRASFCSSMNFLLETWRNNHSTKMCKASSQRTGFGGKAESTTPLSSQCLRRPPSGRSGCAARASRPRGEREHPQQQGQHRCRSQSWSSWSSSWSTCELGSLMRVPCEAWLVVAKTRGARKLGQKRKVQRLLKPRGGGGRCYGCSKRVLLDWCTRAEREWWVR